MNAIHTTTTATANATATLSAVDEAFFRVTASLFRPSFVFGAGVLLATYDDEDEPPVPMVRAPRGAATGSAPVPTSVSA